MRRAAAGFSDTRGPGGPGATQEGLKGQSASRGPTSSKHIFQVRRQNSHFQTVKSQKSPRADLC